VTNIYTQSKKISFPFSAALARRGRNKLWLLLGRPPFVLLGWALSPDDCKINKNYSPSQHLSSSSPRQPPPPPLVLSSAFKSSLRQEPHRQKHVLVIFFTPLIYIKESQILRAQVSSGARREAKNEGPALLLAAREWCRRRRQRCSEIHSLLLRLVADYISPAFFCSRICSICPHKTGGSA
jgi:hypothetical protein